MTVATWETISKSATDSTQRMSVPGGWIVCRVNGLHLPQALVGWFVPDQEHTWIVDLLPTI